jgi:hypothetical protein
MAADGDRWEAHERTDGRPTGAPRGDLRASAEAAGSFRSSEVAPRPHRDRWTPVEGRLTGPRPRPRPLPGPFPAPSRPRLGRDAAATRVVRRSYRGRSPLTRCSIKSRGYGRPPQIRRLFPVHTLGTGKLSRLCPQAPWMRDDRARSMGCGFVDEGHPQPVDEKTIHRLCTKFSTGNPQAEPACPQRSPASPHGCPLFGNVTRLLTAPSERRHTRLPREPVGKTTKPGDDAGDK